ncbi:MAG TPA: phage terminase large subunit [Pseudolabrys sp.]|nr:phage terminase large subunit [Pseudolabrys sp.]
MGPQAGPQERALECKADILIFGGGAGGGKTHSLLLEAVRNKAVKGFAAVVFRRQATQITSPGGLWDQSQDLYPQLGGIQRNSPHPLWKFRPGAAIQMRHLQRDPDVYAYQGAQIPLIMWDELTHFTRKQFFYMLSRNRSTCGVRPYMRATCNPDADSWVAELLAWWIDQETGYPIPERDGVLRYFTRVGDELVWGDSRNECALLAGTRPHLVKSITFIAATIHDNKILLEKDPGYLANLMAMSRVERERLLGGNWKVRHTPGSYFQRTDVQIIKTRPTDVIAWVRRWDLAATLPTEENPDPDWTAGVLMGLRANGRYVVADVQRVRRRASDVRTLIANTTTHDGPHVVTVVPQDPGQAGKDQAEGMVAELAGNVAKSARESGKKHIRAEPFAAQWQAGNVEVVAGPWNEAFFNELEGFPNSKIHDDQVDASSGAFSELVTNKMARFLAMSE